MQSVYRIVLMNKWDKFKIICIEFFLIETNANGNYFAKNDEHLFLSKFYKNNYRNIQKSWY